MREPPRILVVEDDAKMRQLIRMALESNDMRYAEATSAREAMSKAQNDLPDVVIADLAMPAGGGIETVRGIRLWSSLRIVVLCAQSGRVREGSGPQCRCR